LHIFSQRFIVLASLYLWNIINFNIYKKKSITQIVIKLLQQRNVMITKTLHTVINSTDNKCILFGFSHGLRYTLVHGFSQNLCKETTRRSGRFSNKWSRNPRLDDRWRQLLQITALTMLYRSSNGYHVIIILHRLVYLRYFLQKWCCYRFIYQQFHSAYFSSRRPISSISDIIFFRS